MGAPEYGGHRTQDLAWVSPSSFFFVWLMRLCCKFSALLKENLVLSRFSCWRRRTWGCWTQLGAPGAEWGWAEVRQDWLHCRVWNPGALWELRLKRISAGSGEVSRAWHRSRAARPKDGKWGLKGWCEVPRVLKNSPRAWLSCGWGRSCWASQPGLDGCWWLTQRSNLGWISWRPCIFWSPFTPLWW